MKKYLLMLFGIISFLGINTVKAATIEKNGIYVASNFYDNFDYLLNEYNTYKENIDQLINYWESNHSNEFPYYFIRVFSSDISGTTFILYSSDSSYFLLESGSLRLTGTHFVASSDDPYYSVHNSLGYLYTYKYSTKTGYSYSGVNSYPSIGLDNGYIVDSNVNPIYQQKIYSYSQSGTTYIEDFTGIQFPSFTSSSSNFSINEIEIKDGDNFPTLKSLIDGSYSSLNNNYIDINLNDYSYVALSLKDYDTIPDNNYSIYSNIYVKGQLCVTPVYNYGMTERKDILTGTQVQGCSQYYDDFTLTRMYILKDDVENHAIYYIKAYDTSKDNIIKIDKSIFNVSYITEANKDIPQVNINGKIYPTLSYDILTDTSIKSEEEGYISGVTCAVGDFNCYSEYNPENLFDKIFSSPLDILKGIWSSITSVFSLIPYFLNLLPDTMQSFLYLSFMIAIIIGLLKILL